MIEEQLAQKVAASSLAEAREGELVAVKGAYSEPYWVGIVLARNEQKRLLCVWSERFTRSCRNPEQDGYWYNFQGVYTNAQGRVHKRVPWGVGTIEVLTEAIRDEITHQVEAEKLSGFRTFHYGLLKEADLPQLQALVAYLTKDVPLPPKKQENYRQSLRLLILGIITEMILTERGTSFDSRS